MKAVDELAKRFEPSIGKPPVCMTSREALVGREEGLRETAIEGYADSQYMLSFMLLDGTDVKRRSAQAYVWAALALIQGQQQAQEIRDAAAMRIDEAETSDALFVLSQCESSGVGGCLLSLDSLP